MHHIPLRTRHSRYRQQRNFLGGILTWKFQGELYNWASSIQSHLCTGLACHVCDSTHSASYITSYQNVTEVYLCHSNKNQRLQTNLNWGSFVVAPALLGDWSRDPGVPGINTKVLALKSQSLARQLFFNHLRPPQTHTIDNFNLHPIKQMVFLAQK